MHNPGKLSHKFSTTKVLLIQKLGVYHHSKIKGREDTKYRDDDKILHEHIRIVNTFVRETNLIYRRESPRFSFDIENCRRDKYKKKQIYF
jgi:hypothetical protein